VLLGRSIATRAEMESGAMELMRRHGCAVLLKGGHLSSEEASDVLVTESELLWFEGQRFYGVQTHGTGCTYSAAIAAGLARGYSLIEAVRQGKQFVSTAISKHFRWGDIDALNHGG
ncbi:MAG: bifunctional hydroxymethylpyrimidine kinase/phosphomethylpyrimidine kinase, partial [Verrucomicrobiaceae bacterium]